MQVSITIVVGEIVAIGEPWLNLRNYLTHAKPAMSFCSLESLDENLIRTFLTCHFGPFLFDVKIER